MSTLPSGRAVLDEMARRVIDQNLYMVLGTMDPDGQPRLSPVYFTAARYEDFYWVSLPESHHSGNVADRPEVRIVVFDSSSPPGRPRPSTCRPPPGWFPSTSVVDEAFRTAGGAVRFTPAELSGDARLRLFVAHATSFEVHVRGRHPTHGRGYDSRQTADPRAGL